MSSTPLKSRLRVPGSSKPTRSVHFHPYPGLHTVSIFHRNPKERAYCVARFANEEEYRQMQLEMMSYRQTMDVHPYSRIHHGDREDDDADNDGDDYGTEGLELYEDGFDDDGDDLGDDPKSDEGLLSADAKSDVGLLGADAKSDEGLLSNAAKSGENDGMSNDDDDDEDDGDKAYSGDDEWDDATAHEYVDDSYDFFDGNTFKFPKSVDELLSNDAKSDDGLLGDDTKSDGLLSNNAKSDDGLLSNYTKSDGLLSNDTKSVDGLLSIDAKSEDGLLSNDAKSVDGLLSIDAKSDDNVGKAAQSGVSVGVANDEDDVGYMADDESQPIPVHEYDEEAYRGDDEWDDATAHEYVYDSYDFFDGNPFKFASYKGDEGDLSRGARSSSISPCVSVEDEEDYEGDDEYGDAHGMYEYVYDSYDHFYGNPFKFVEQIDDGYGSDMAEDTKPVYRFTKAIRRKNSS